MKLIFKGHDARYAVEQSLLAFFPQERPVYDPAAREENWAAVSLSCGTQYTTSVTQIYYNGSRGKGIARVIIIYESCFSPVTEKRRKYELQHAFCVLVSHFLQKTKTGIIKLTPVQ